MVNPISGFPPVDPASFQRPIQKPEAQPTSEPAATSASSSPFLDTLKKTIDQAQQVQTQADQQVSRLVSGQGGDIHSAMIAVEKADLSFQLIMQVRNKIIQAYEQISQMQF